MTNQSRVREKMAEFLGRPINDLDNHALLADLVVESFMLVEMVIGLQEEFGGRFFVQDDLKDIKTVGDLLMLFEGLVHT
jgi:acyl carrier protein